MVYLLVWVCLMLLCIETSCGNESCSMLASLQDSKFPRDTGVNPRLTEAKGASTQLLRAGGVRLGHSWQAHSLAVTRYISPVGSSPACHMVPAHSLARYMDMVFLSCPSCYSLLFWMQCGRTLFTVQLAAIWCGLRCSLVLYGAMCGAVWCCMVLCTAV